METTAEKPILQTGHPVFDQIFYIRKGMTILVTDETFSEAKSFLHALLKNHRGIVVELVSSRYIPKDSGLFTVPIEALQDLSININQRRRTDKGKIFIHLYLPELLIRHNPDEVLKVMELWQKDVSQTGTVEFYLLPRNTFGDFERKARAILDAVIDIHVVRQDNQFVYYFTPMRSCAPRYHLKNIRYEILENRFLIEWEGVLTDSLPSRIVTANEVREKIEADGDRFVLHLGNINPENFSVSDYVLLTSIEGLRVSDVKMLYPDKWHEISDRIVQWVVGDVLKMEETSPERKYEIRKTLKLKNKLLLAVPTRFSLLMVSLSKGFLGKRVRTVPLDAHLALLTAMKNVVDIFSGRNPDLRKEVRLATKYFGELSARKTAIEYILRLEGTPYTRFSMQHIPKLIAITLMAGWGIEIRFLSSSSNSWVFEVKKCHLCEGIQSDEPFCDKFVSSVVAGVIGVCLRREVECSEITCKAMGSDSCRFRAHLH